MNSQNCFFEAYFTYSKVKKLIIKLLPKILPEICCPKLTLRQLQSYSPMESCSSKLLLPEAASWSGKLSKVAPKAATHSCSLARLPMLFSKAVALKLRFCTQNGSPKLFCTAAPESCARKLLLKAAPWSCEVVCTAAPERCCSLKQKCPESCSGQHAKTALKASVRSYCPKIAIFQTYT